MPCKVNFWANLAIFLKKLGHIDVWWIRQDGGMSLLLASLIRRVPTWKKTSLRVYITADPTDNSEAMRKALVEYLLDMRIQAEGEFSNCGTRLHASLGKFVNKNRAWKSRRTLELRNRKTELDIMLLLILFFSQIQWRVKIENPIGRKLISFFFTLLRS